MFIAGLALTEPAGGLLLIRRSVFIRINTNKIGHVYIRYVCCETRPLLVSLGHGKTKSCSD